MDFTFIVAGKTYKVSTEFRDGQYLVSVGEKEWKVDAQLVSENCLSILSDNETRVVFFAENEGKRYLFVGGEQFCLEEVETATDTGVRTEARVAEGLQVITPVMPGKVVKVRVSEGEAVEKDQTLVIVEAMKMENEMRAPAKGRVKKIHVAPGHLVNLGQPMVELDMGG